ncbi:hypothetical protein, partial [Ruminococcus sp.]
EEDQYNDCYGRERMYLALQQRKDAGKTDIDIPCETTVRKVMVQIGLMVLNKEIDSQKQIQA